MGLIKNLGEISKMFGISISGLALGTYIVAGAVTREWNPFELWDALQTTVERGRIDYVKSLEETPDTSSLRNAQRDSSCSVKYNSRRNNYDFVTERRDTQDIIYCI